MLPFDRQAAEVYGRIAADLERRGLTIGFPDLQIAAIALSRNLEVITHNLPPKGQDNVRPLLFWSKRCLKKEVVSQGPTLDLCMIAGPDPKFPFM